MELVQAMKNARVLDWDTRLRLRLGHIYVVCLWRLGHTDVSESIGGTTS